MGPFSNIGYAAQSGVVMLHELRRGYRLEVEDDWGFQKMSKGKWSSGDRGSAAPYLPSGGNQTSKLATIRKRVADARLPIGSVGNGLLTISRKAKRCRVERETGAGNDELDATKLSKVKHETLFTPVSRP
jgi:hypothetical protein